MTDIGSAVGGGAFMICVGLISIALALVFVGLQIKKHTAIIKEKSE
jgi:hypothetical protein